MRQEGVGDALDSLRETFAERFGGTPTHLSRAPGRVNLIGEHTDYNDLPVLPMALQQDVKVAFRERDDDLVRVDTSRFQPDGVHGASEVIDPHAFAWPWRSRPQR